MSTKVATPHYGADVCVEMSQVKLETLYSICQDWLNFLTDPTFFVEAVHLALHRVLKLGCTMQGQDSAAFVCTSVCKVTNLAFRLPFAGAGYLLNFLHCSPRCLELRLAFEAKLVALLVWQLCTLDVKSYCGSRSILGMFGSLKIRFCCLRKLS